ncbi:MAG: 30S ribosomal protein S2 [Candidatus Aenigmatarchaeota archaeon]
MELLVDRKTYILYFLPLGKGFNKHMEKFIYKKLPNGNVFLDVREIDKRIRILGKYIANKNVVIVNRNERYFAALKEFENLTNAKIIYGRFLPGTFTNPSSENYIEPDAVLVFDLIKDKQAVREAVKMNIPLFALCNSLDIPTNVDFIIPINNKSRKSIALFLWLLAREIQLNKGIISNRKDFKVELNSFAEKAIKGKVFIV